MKRTQCRPPLLLDSTRAREDADVVSADHDGTRAVNPLRGVHRLAVLTAAATLLLLLVGGLVTSTGSGLAVPDWPLSFGRFFPPIESPYITVHFAHRIGALVVALAVVATAAVAGRCHRGDDRLLRPALLALALLVLQITLGGVTIWSRRAVPATTSHLVVGAALLATSLALTLRASRFVGWRRVARATAGPGRHPFP